MQIEQSFYSKGGNIGFVDSAHQISAKSIHWFTSYGYFKVTDQHACCSVNFRKGQTDTILPTPDFKPLNMLELRAIEFELVPNRFLIPMLQYTV